MINEESFIIKPWCSPYLLENCDFKGIIPGNVIVTYFRKIFKLIPDQSKDRLFNTDQKTFITDTAH